MITEIGIKKYLQNELKLTIFDELESTNTKAKELADGGSTDDAVIIARRQSDGRGRMGRSFFSPNGGLYMSLLLHPKLHASKAIHITTAAAVAVCRAIESVSGRACEIKWVNDVYIDGRKVCGILTESRMDGEGALSYAVLGIGVNLVPPEDGFPEEIRSRAGAVFDSICDDVGDRLAAAIINEFMTIYKAGLSAESFISEYRRRSFLIGREVDVMRIHDGSSRPAVAIAIDDDFGLLVCYPDGTSELVSSGDVSVRGSF